jgi:hypothetical protein
MEKVHLDRGSVAPIVKGQTCEDAVAKWRQAIAPNLSPATVRQRESYLRNHLMPRFGQYRPVGTRTPDLYRVKVPLIGFTTTYKTAGTAKVRGSSY